MIWFVRIDTFGRSLGGTFVDCLVEYARRGGDTSRHLEAEVRRAEVPRFDFRRRMSMKCSASSRRRRQICPMQPSWRLDETP